MKHLFFVLLVILAAACQRGPTPVVSPSGEEIASPAAYNDYFIKLQSGIMREMESFSVALESFEPATIAKEHAILLSVIDSTIAKVKATPAFDNDNILRPAFIDLFIFYREISSEEYGTIKDLIEGGEESITDDDLRLIDSLTKDIALKETKMRTIFGKSQSRFAEKYGLQIDKPAKEKKQ